MTTILALLKLISAFILIGTFMLVSLVVIVVVRDLKVRRKYHSKIVSFYSRLMLAGLNAKVNIINPPKGDQHYLIVSNHLGFIDILMIAASQPSLFITSVELRETPGLGPITEIGGCLYVERRSRANIQNEVQWIRNALVDGHNIVLFPEAASMSGEKVYPFKKTLITAAAGTGVPILPIVINFRKANGEPVSHKYRDHLFWYGDHRFESTLWKTLHLWSIEVDLEFLAPVICHSEEDRRHVTQHIQSLVESKYIPIPFPEQVSPA